MWRTICLILVLLLVVLTGVTASAHVGDVDIQLIDFTIPGGRTVANCPVAVTFTRNGHIHHGSDGNGFLHLPDGRIIRVAHTAIYYSTGYSQSNGFGVSYAAFATNPHRPDSRTLRFPLSQFRKVIGLERERLTAGWNVSISTGLTEFDMERYGRVPPQHVEKRSRRFSGELSAECLEVVRVQYGMHPVLDGEAIRRGLKEDTLPEWQPWPPPQPRTTATPTPTPTPVDHAADCQFILGFKTLRDLIGHDIVGDCLENEYWNEIGDSNQRTTGGLMAWRKADNWTAFTDGYRTWINGPNGLVQRLNTERFEWEADYAEIMLG